MTSNLNSILCLFLLSDFLGMYSCEKRRFKVFVYNWTKCTHSDTSFRTIRSLSVQECILECRLRASCKAVEFIIARRACSLFDTEGTLKEPKTRNPCVIIRMSDVMDIIPFPEFCQTCSAVQRCDIHSQHCVTEECERHQSTEDTTIFGNMNIVGSTVKHVPSSCSDLGSYYREEARCMAGGLWDIDVVTFLNWCFQLKGSIYFMAPAKTYADGLQYCSSHGAHLIQFESEDEQSRVTAYVRDSWATPTWQTPARCWWLGITDAEVEGIWKYSNTNQEIVFKKWRYGEPNNVGDAEHCAIIQSFGLHEEWVDLPCSFICGTICEK